MAHISAISVHDFADSGKKVRKGESSLMWGRGGSGRAARHRAYTWGMANNDQGYDPFEPGHSTPEFEQFARENQKYRKASHARGGAGGQKRTSSAGARSAAAGNAGSRAAGPAGKGGSPSSGGSGKHAPRGAGRTVSQARVAGGRKAAGRAAAPMQKGASSRSSRPASPQPPLQTPEPEPVLARAHSKAHNVVGILVCVLLAIALEVFGYNFQFFYSMTYPDAGSYLVNGAQPSQVGTITLDSSSSSFEITGLNSTVRSIHFTPVLSDAAGAAKATDSKIQVVISLADEGNANYYANPAVSVDPADPATTYISLDPAGKCHSIKVNMTNLADIGAVQVSGISLNQKVPFDFDPLRAGSVFAILLVLFALRPASGLYSRVRDSRLTSHRILIVALVAVQCVVVLALVLSNSHYVSLTQTPSYENQFQYQKLAVALTQGHLYLNDVPSDALQAMANPYDTQARAAQGVPYLWDHAYFHGKYYVYFGILPCLVFYVPWLLVTHTGFPTWLGIAICDCVYAAGLMYLLSAVRRRWFPRTSIGVLVVLDVMLFVAGGGIILARTPSMYFMPEAMSLALVSWGLGLWVSGTSRGYIERGKIVLGALLIALTMASRPQMVLSAVFGLVLFWPFLRDSKGDRGARRDVMGAFKVAMVPFVLVAIAVLVYNAARFGSPFDFGANYNLTTNDMTHRGFHLDRIPFGLYAYLFQPPVFGSQFPFLRQAYLDPAYQGITIYEPMFGGYFFLYPMTLAVLGIVIGRVRAHLKEQRLMPLFVALVCVAFALCIFDLQGAGILMRYVCDFGLFFALAGAIVFLALLQVKSEKRLTKDWTTQFSAVGSRGAVAAAGAGAETVSVYRISLYFMFATLVLMVIMNVMLWNAFGMY